MSQMTYAISGHGQTATPCYYYMYEPAELETKEAQIELPVVPGWWDSDYQDCREMLKLMGDGKPWDYAQCVWMRNQREQNLVFGRETWDKWYEYALKVCPRFAKEQGRWMR